MSSTSSTSSSPSLSGAFTALVTPFTPSGDAIDEAAFEKLVERQIAGGIAGLVPCGTTGETPTLTDAEQVDVIRRTVQAARGRVPVYAGTGSFSTKKTIESSKRAIEAGATGVMVVMPYYSKPTQDGLVEHVKAVASAVDAPIILYNIPGRSSIDLGVEATARICDACPNVVATKEATGNVLRCQELKRTLGDRLTVLSGDDGLTVAMMAVGAAGVISVTSNVLPAAVSNVVALMLAGKYAEARAAHFRLVPVHDAMFIEANPGPVKAVAELRGEMGSGVRLPLVPASAATRERLRAVMAAYEAAK